MHVRWLINTDIIRIMEIECFTSRFPWNEQDFRAFLIQKNVIGMVIQNVETFDPEDDAEVVGYMIYSLQDPDCIEVLKFAVDPFYQQRGIGTKLMNKLVSKLGNKRTKISLNNIDDDNLEAHLFLKKMGFQGQINEENVDEYDFLYSTTGLTKKEPKKTQVSFDLFDGCEGA